MLILLLGSTECGTTAVLVKKGTVHRKLHQPMGEGVSVDSSVGTH